MTFEATISINPLSLQLAQAWLIANGLKPIELTTNGSVICQASISPVQITQLMTNWQNCQHISNLVATQQRYLVLKDAIKLP